LKFIGAHYQLTDGGGRSPRGERGLKSCWNL